MVKNFLGRVGATYYYLAPSSMSCYGKPDNHINYHYEVITMRGGAEVANVAVSYIFDDQFGAPASIKANLRQVVESCGYDPVTLCKA